MTSWGPAIEALAVWKHLSLDKSALAGPEGDARRGCLARQCELVSARLLPRAPDAAEGPGRTAVFALSRQTPGSSSGAACTNVVVQVSIVLEPGAPDKGGDAAADAADEAALLVEVPGYNVEADGPFRQILASPTGRAALLVSPRCCAAFAVPDIRPGRPDGKLQVSAIPLAPPGEGGSFVRVQWHPLSDVHVGALLSDGTWQLLNLSHRATIADPEVCFQVKFGGSAEPDDSVADFAFGAPPGHAGGFASAIGDLWSAMAVVFLSARGRVCFRSPVLPSQAVLPSAALEALCREGTGDMESQRYVHETLLRSGRNMEEVPGAAGVAMTHVQHRLHMHGDAAAYAQLWTPAEQLLAEERDDAGEQTPRSPKHCGSEYCSVHVVAHSPLAVVARATVTGLIEIVILGGGLAPKFQPRGARFSGADTSVSGVVFDEVDLALGATRAPAVALAGAPALEDAGGAGGAPVLVARSRSLVAAVELPWVGALQSGAGAPVEGLPLAAVTTLAEAKPGDGCSEIAGWQLLPGNGCVGLSLRAGTSGAGGANAVAHCVDVWAALRAAGKTRASKPAGGAAGAAGQGPQSVGHSQAEREEYLRHLAAPVHFPQPLFGKRAEDGPGGTPLASAVAEAVAEVHAGQVANLEARQLVLEHLAGQLPTRAASVRADVARMRKMSTELAEATCKTERRAEQIRKRQEDLEAQHRELVAALGARLELRELDDFAAGELPKLWSHLHDLRQAFELLRAAAAPAGGKLAAAGLASDRLAAIEGLQRRWTDASASQLRHTAAQVEAAVAALARKHSGKAIAS